MIASHWETMDENIETVLIISCNNNRQSICVDLFIISPIVNDECAAEFYYSVAMIYL